MPDAPQDTTQRTRTKNPKLKLYQQLYDIHIGSPVEIAVLQNLIWRCNPQYIPLQCWPGIKRIAADLDAHPDTIRRTLKKLDTKGFIEIRPRKRPDGQTSNLYIINEWRLLPRSNGNKLDEIPD